MRKYDMIQKLHQAEQHIAMQMGRIAAYKQEIKNYQTQIEWLQLILHDLMSRNIFKRLWAARKRVK